MLYNNVFDLVKMLDLFLKDCACTSTLPSMLSNPKTTSANLPSRLGTLID